VQDCGVAKADFEVVTTEPIRPRAAVRETTMTRFVRQNLPTSKKTASYYLVHISVAAMVASAVTGDLWMSLTLSLLGTQAFKPSPSSSTKKFGIG